MTSPARATSFGSAAQAYQRHRPQYAAAAVDWALAPAPGPRILDLAAGTGKLTDALAARPGAAVTAVEPDADMLGQLTARLPQVDGRIGHAEAIPLPDASVDAVVVGQAWHWFDHERALLEVARVLTPGGVLAALWNDEDVSVPWVADFVAAVREMSGGRSMGPAFYGATTFPGSETAAFPNPLTTDSAGVVATIGTHSWTLILDPPARRQALDRLTAYLQIHAPDGDSFVWPLVTTVRRMLPAA